MAKSEPLLARLLNTPDLATIVPHLQPEVLHRVIQACGLEDCVEFVALATPEQLARVLDLDIWHPRTPGSDEQFDADRFGVWIAVLMESGAALAAEKLAGLDIELVITGVARHAAVFDQAAVSPYTTLDGESVPGRAMNGGPVSEIGGYAIEARRTSAWEAIVDLLTFLNAEHADYFHRVMRGCVGLSNAGREQDASHDLLEDDEQAMFDLGCEREERRERQGYVTPAQAHAFLRSGRELGLDAERPPRSPLARAYFRTVESTLASNTDAPVTSGAAAPASDADALAPIEPAGVVEFVNVLRDAGVVEPSPRALLGAADQQTSRVSLIQRHVAAHPACAEELAYLANAVIAGCSILGRPLTIQEASDAVTATCNLGLENWPPRWSDPDLVTAFQVGWSILHRDVCMRAAKELIDVLRGLRCGDREIQLRLDGLRRDLVRSVRDREPWRARNALDVILMMDPPSWAALLALIDECPVIHAAMSASRQRHRAIDPADFEFISQNSQIAAVREFMASLQLALMNG